MLAAMLFKVYVKYVNKVFIIVALRDLYTKVCKRSTFIWTIIHFKSKRLHYGRKE